MGVNVPLALNTNLHSERPDNLIRLILEGVQNPATPAIGFMLGFKGSLSPAQLGELVDYLRARFAPGRPAWEEVAQAVKRLGAAP